MKLTNYKSLIYSLIPAIFVFYMVQLVLSWSHETEHQNVYYNTGVIVDIGQCYNDKCAFKYKDQFGSEKFGTSNKPVIKGQLVYQECWYEIKNGNQCYVEYSPSGN